MTWLINQSIQNSKFPDDPKSAEISPISKKGNTHYKKNYRPVSILPCFSKIFEGILIDKMYNFMNPLLSPFLSGFRKGHNCQNVLLRLIEIYYWWRWYQWSLTDWSFESFWLSAKSLVGSEVKSIRIQFRFANYFINSLQRVKYAMLKMDGWD